MSESLAKGAFRCNMCSASIPEGGGHDCPYMGMGLVETIIRLTERVAVLEQMMRETHRRLAPCTTSASPKDSEKAE